jgi:anaerobic dimethyl sulfoxide reductase subunit C (anchor subunit)
MKERSLVAFTLLSQMAVGAFWVLGVLHLWAFWQAGAVGVLTGGIWFVVPLVMALALLASFLHLGVPLNAWRAFANLASSWLSREVLFALLFTGASGLFAVLHGFSLGSSFVRAIIAGAAALLGLGLIASMANAYRLRTVPAWDTWVTPVSFFISALLLGGLLIGALLVLVPGVRLDSLDSVLRGIALGAAVLLSTELVVLLLWLSGLAAGRGATSRSTEKVIQEHRVLFRLRLMLVVLSIAICGFASFIWGQGLQVELVIILSFTLVLSSEVLGRLLFYEARVRHGV